MRNILTVIILLVTSCGPVAQNTNVTYQNLVILSDMSSRLDNKASKDIIEIHKLVEFFKNECVKPGKKLGDKSSISFSKFSGITLASIDISKLETLAEKQQFVNSTGNYQDGGLKKQIEYFEQKVKEAYNDKRNQGLDLISILSEKINTEAIIKTNENLVNDLDTTFINYENHIYIFTDGYLEYLNKDINNQFYFGISEIDKIRQYAKKEAMDISKVLEAKNTFGLPPVKNSKNQHINLHILETHERDKNESLQTYRYPKGLRDNEILEAVWKKWALESGFNSFEWKKY